MVPLAQILLARRGGSKEPDKETALRGAKGKVISANSVFISAALYLTILVGGLIPSAVIASSPEDFVSYTVFYDPMGAVIAAFCLAIGYFLVWFGIFYGLAAARSRRLFALVMSACGIIATLDYMIFKPKASSSILSRSLVYENGLLTDSRLALIGLMVGVVVLALVVYTGRRHADLWRSIIQVMSIVVLIMTILNVSTIRSAIRDFQQRSNYMAQYGEDQEITFSKTGQNVLVIMLDRAIGAYMPYLLAERPDLEETYDGFTYYPNTLSYGGRTIYGSPGLAGGYEYTTVAINKRSEELLADKHNEALLSMPVLFSEEGYDVTVCDPPYAGYVEQGDYSIYDAYPGITAIQTEAKNNPYKVIYEEELYRIRKRNLFCYSVVRVMPLVLQSAMYNEGQYNTAPSSANNPYAQAYTQTGAHVSEGNNGNFLDAWYVLTNLNEMTRTCDNEKGAYVFLNNDTVHNASLLVEPSYTPAYEVDNTAYDAEHTDRFTVDGVTVDMYEGEWRMAHYESMMAALLELGEWFDYLRENDLYDNTRIIIVSDHAYNLRAFPDRIMSDGTDTMQYNPLLMVKDYNAHGFETSEEFMTNADVPYLSVQDVIENPVNPFTGNAITDEGKQGTQYVLKSDVWNPSEQNGTQFKTDAWLSVKDDVRDINNWSVVSEGTALPEE